MFDVINLSEAKGKEGGLKMLKKQGLAFVFGFADGVMKKTEGQDVPSFSAAACFANRQALMSDMNLKIRN